MGYLKITDFTGYLSLPSTTPQIEARLLNIIAQIEVEILEYVLGEPLASAFIADLDSSGNPVATRFINLNAQMRSAITHLTYVECQSQFAMLTAPIGNQVSESNNMAITALDGIWDRGIDLARRVREWLEANATDYPEYCPCHCKVLGLKKSII